MSFVLDFKGRKNLSSSFITRHKQLFTECFSRQCRLFLLRERIGQKKRESGADFENSFLKNSTWLSKLIQAIPFLGCNLWRHCLMNHFSLLLSRRRCSDTTNCKRRPRPSRPSSSWGARRSNRSGRSWKRPAPWLPKPRPFENGACRLPITSRVSKLSSNSKTTKKGQYLRRKLKRKIGGRIDISSARFLFSHGARTIN